MNIQKIKLSMLKPAKYNPRKDLQKDEESYKKIKASIEEFGFVDPLIINKDFTIIGGHQRYNILLDLGYEEAECVILDLNSKKEKELNLSLNKNSGYWDNDKLKELFDELELTQEELFATGFDMSEIEELNTDFISDLLEDEFTTTDRQLDKFSITFNIPKQHEEKFSNYIKKNGKDFLVEILVNEVERLVL